MNATHSPVDRPSRSQYPHTPAATYASLPFRATSVAIAVATSITALAQTPPAPPVAAKDETTLKPVVVKEKEEVPLGRDSIRATTSTIGKGNQPLRDIPQSVTTVTEKLITDRNLDTFRDTLRNTAGATFLAAEGGEEDIRLRGFSLAQTGDIFLDGMRDAAFYDRDTFNLDRLDVLRGSASMLFGRGSTGGVANQVSKSPHRVDDRSVSLTVGNFDYRRVVADVNQRIADDTAVRIVGMHTKADNNGAGSELDKQGIAASIRHGIGQVNEFQASLFHLDNRNGMNYGLPWIRPTPTSSSAENTIIPGLEPEAYYGVASDYNHGKATLGTLIHTHRFSPTNELKTQLRYATYERDQRASTVRFTTLPSAPAPAPGIPPTTLQNLNATTPLSRGTQLKIQSLDTLQLQSDYSGKFAAFGLKHNVLAGFDLSEDKREVFGARNAAQGGVTINKPIATIGTPNNGVGVDESLRVLRAANDFRARAAGAYVQDLVEVTPVWKALAGLRYDYLKGEYNAYAIPNNAAGPTTMTRYSQNVSEWSYRVGALYQPSDRYSFHLSYGTSFNTSGDTYSYNARSANTPPESSENFELGGRIESSNKQLSARFALFHSVKKNERNTDPDTAATRLLLSGKRHSSGVELDLAGRITPAWELFLSYAWTPIARVDQAASTATTVGNRVGDRPGLSPKHSGTVWSTYQLTSKWRIGGGLNFRSRQAPADVTAPAWEAPGYVTADAFAEYKHSEKVSFRGNVINVANKYYADSLYRGHYIPGAGRLLQLNMTLGF